MSLFVNAFNVAVYDDIVRIKLKDVQMPSENVEGTEQIVGDIVMMRANATALADWIYKLNEAHAEKMLAEQATRDAEPKNLGDGDLVNVPQELNGHAVEVNAETLQ